ncbi:MAG: Adaptive-response sensory-kinase SasA [Elusimicrobia bacterium]|nr:Adaptive-response sensory-kinase SasA [Elusimicrobiota bacterium]
MRLQLFIGSTLVNAIFSFGMVALVLFSRPITKVKTTWAAMCFSVGIWNLSVGLMASTKDYKMALLAVQFANTAALFITTLLLHTVYALLKLSNKKPLYLFYASAFLMSIGIFGGFMLDVRPILEFPYFTIQKPPYFLFVVHFYSGFLMVEYLLWRTSQTASPLIKKQLLSLFWGAGLAFLGGQTTVPLVYGYPLFPYGVFFVPVYILFVGHSMLKYQFLDFQMAFRKLGLTLGLYALLIMFMVPLCWPLIISVFNRPSEVKFEILTLSGILSTLMIAGPLLYTLILQKTYWLKGHNTIALTHELKSPLANILGVVETLEKSNFTYADILQRNVNRIENLVEKLLNLAAIQEGEINLNFKEFSLPMAAQTVIAHFLPLAEKKGLKISFRCDQDIPFLGDQDKIEQVFSNLISNAVKHSQQGTIEVSIQIIEREIICSVRDQGEGIPIKDLTRVFNRFYQGSKTAQGTGIGLTIAKAWVQAHGGKIWAESGGPNQGSCLIFNLPNS